MRRVVAVAGLLLLFAVGLQPAAHAGTVPPVVEVERAWVVQKGAALQVAYTVTCPDRGDRGVHHAMVTNGDYLEFTCGPRPRRIVQLLEGPAAKGDDLTLNTRVISPRCMYYDYSDPDFVVPGCHVVERTDSLRVRAGRFETESAAGRAGKVDIKRVRAAKDGAVRLTARFSCARPVEGWVPSQVSQMTRAGFTSAAEGERYVSCEPGESQRVSWIARPAEGDPPFTFKRKVVVSLEWAYHYEGGQWGYHSGLHKVVGSNGTPSVSRLAP